jgi:putative hydrolase of the HAD superfamily
MKPGRAAHRVILFDLGGVLWDVGGRPVLAKLSGGALTPDQERRYWRSSPWQYAFDTGRCTPREFASGVIGELDLAVEPADLLKALAEIDRGLFPGALSLLDALEGRYLRACLSNNNAFHWERLKQNSGLHLRFERCYLSHEVGLRKPDPALFRHVLDDLGIPSSEILFLDDDPGYVEAARDMGLDAHQALGVEGVRRVLGALDIRV